MNRQARIVQYWGGCPSTPNSKWRRFLEVIRACAERGWKTYLVWSAMPEEPSLWKPFTEAGCRIVLQPRATRNFDWRCVWRTYRLLRRIGCDVFHCHNVHTSPLIGAALAGTPVRIWSKLAMSPYYEQGIAPKGIHKSYPSVRVSCYLAHRVLTISEAVKAELMLLGIGSSKVKVLRVPVDLDSYANASTNGFRKALGLPESGLVIASVGRADPVKGWDVLIKAFGGVAHKVPESHLVLVGSMRESDGTFPARLRALVREHNLCGRVHFTGTRRDVGRVLKASDVFAFPSRSDGQGLALVEAMASGLPCVASRVGGIPEVIRDGQSGLLFERERQEQLAAHLEALLRDAELRKRLGANAKGESMRFSLAAYTEALLAHYQRSALAAI